MSFPQDVLEEGIRWSAGAPHTQRRRRFQVNHNNDAVTQDLILPIKIIVGDPTPFNEDPSECQTVTILPQSDDDEVLLLASYEAAGEKIEEINPLMESCGLSFVDDVDGVRLI